MPDGGGTISSDAKEACAASTAFLAGACAVIERSPAAPVLHVDDRMRALLPADPPAGFSAVDLCEVIEPARPAALLAALEAAATSPQVLVLQSGPAAGKAVELCSGVIARRGALLLRVLVEDCGPRLDAPSPSDVASESLRLRARFDALMANAPVQIAVKGRDGRVQFANGVAQAMRPAGAPALIGATLKDLYDAETAEALLEVETGVFETGGMARTERCVTCADGVRRIFEDRRFAFHDPVANDTALGVVSIDVTDLRERERALSSAKADLAAMRDVMEDAAVGLMVFDRRTGALTQANRHGRRDLGLGDDEVGSQMVGDVIPELARQFFGDGDTASFSGEVQVRRMDGSTYQALCHADIYAGDEGDDSVVAFLQDISEFAATRELLAAAERKLELALEGFADGFFEWEPGAAAFSICDVTRRMLGLKPGVALNHLEDFADMICPDDRDRFLEAMQQTVAGASEGFDLQVRIRTADGSERVLRSRGRCNSDDRRKVIGVHTDIAAATAQGARRQVSAAEHAELQNELDRQRLEAGRHREFVAMVNHELRTPLAVIDGRARQIARLARGSEQAEAVSERVRSIRIAVSRLIDLMEAVLSAARLEEGRIALHPRRFDLGKLVSEIAETMAEAFPDRVISAEAGEGLDSMFADPTLIRQAIANLAGNACKYSDNGDSVRIVAWRDGDEAVIEVHDTGIGIPADELGKIFDRFFRASTAVGRAGTGIGLHLVHEFVAMHGGRVEIESEVGVGSVFRIRAPYSLPT